MVQKIITFNVALKSTERQWVQKIPEVYTNDLGSVSIKFNITDCTDTELTGSSAIVLLKMRDGSFFQGPSADVERTLNVFSYTLKENEGNHDGLAEIQLIVTISGKEFATQKYQFKVNSGLDSEAAREIMIYDWTTLTAEARAYIDQFTADEMVRDAEFDNNEFDRNTAFVASQDARTVAFGTEQTNRGTAFTAEQNERTTIFNESESGRATAETVRVTAEDGRVEAETDRVTEEDKRVTAESGRVTAESGRVTAETNRAAAFQELVAHKASTSNPHGVTKAQVGLGNVDNTSDANKPVSVAMQAALNLKSDKTVTDGHETRITALEAKAVKQYGVRRTLNASSTLLERLNDGVGLVANVPTDDGAAQNDFDAVYPFSQIKECIIDATGRIHYKGDPTYATAIGDWMVEVPLYYVKDVRTATTQDEYFSAFKLDGYRIPKDFVREDGTVCQKIYYGRFKTGKDGTTDVSRPGLAPSNYRDLASFRTGARAKGAGWQEVGINYVKDFLHKLTKVEFANLNSQTVFGPGITTVRYTRYTATDNAVLAETAVNRFVTTTAIAANFNVGNVINIGTSLGGNNVASMRVITAINVLDASNSEIVFDGAAVNVAIGNIIAMVSQKTGQTVNLQKPSGKLSGISGRTSFKWRGIEDPFGNLCEWVDGVLINDNKGYICNKPSLFASTLTTDYKPLNYTNANTNGYPFEMGYDENYPEAQFPIAVGAGSTTGYADYCYQNTGLRGALFGGDAADGSAAGLFFWSLNYAPSSAPWYLGGRLLFKPPAV